MDELLDWLFLLRFLLHDREPFGISVKLVCIDEVWIEAIEFL